MRVTTANQFNLTVASLQKRQQELQSTVFSSLQPVQLAEWIIADGLPVRFQLQQHKYLWEPNARGV